MTTNYEPTSNDLRIAANVLRYTYKKVCDLQAKTPWWKRLFFEVDDKLLKTAFHLDTIADHMDA